MFLSHIKWKQHVQGMWIYTQYISAKIFDSEKRWLNCCLLVCLDQLILPIRQCICICFLRLLWSHVLNTTCRVEFICEQILSLCHLHLQFHYLEGQFAIQLQLKMQTVLLFLVSSLMLCGCDAQVQQSNGNLTIIMIFITVCLEWKGNPAFPTLPNLSLFLQSEQRTYSWALHLY